MSISPPSQYCSKYERDYTECDLFHGRKGSNSVSIVQVNQAIISQCHPKCMMTIVWRWLGLVLETFWSGICLASCVHTLLGWDGLYRQLEAVGSSPNKAFFSCTDGLPAGLQGCRSHEYALWPRSRKASHSACDSSQAIRTFSCVRACAPACARPVRDFINNLFILNMFGRNDLENRRQFY